MVNMFLTIGNFSGWMIGGIWHNSAVMVRPVSVDRILNWSREPYIHHTDSHSPEIQYEEPWVTLENVKAEKWREFGMTDKAAGRTYCQLQQ